MMYTNRRKLLTGAAALAGLGALGISRARAAVTAIGEAEEVVNVVVATPPGGEQAAMSQGDAVVLDHWVQTGGDSATLLRFADRSKLTVGENAAVVIDEFVYAGPAESRSLIRLARGAFRFLSGDMDEKNVSIETPSVSIGIRGTELKIDVSSDGATEVSVVQGIIRVVGRAGEVLELVTGQSLLSTAAGVLPAEVRPFVHTSPDAAIEQGLEEIRRRVRDLLPDPIRGLPIPLPRIPN